MGKIEQDKAKELLLKGLSRKEVKTILRKKFKSNYNILRIAITRAAKEIDEQVKEVQGEQKEVI